MTRLSSAAKKSIKIVVSLGLILFVLSRIDLRKATLLVGHSSPAYWMLALAVTMLAVVISAFKWQLILKSQGFSVPVVRLTSFYLVGLFFNNFLPTSIGGDAVRAYDVSKHTGRSPEAIASVVIERILASVSLGFISLLAIFLSYQAASRFLGWAIIFFVVCAGILFFILKSELFIKRLNAVKSFRRLGLHQKLTELNEALQAPLQNRETLISVLLLSLLFQVTVVLVNLAVFRALNIAVPAVYLFVFVPIISALSLLPISINGLGIREGGYIYFFSQVGLTTTQAVASSLGFFFAVTAVSLVGGLVLAFRR